MLVIGSAGGPWIQLLNFFFFLAALFNDVLLIRLSLGGGFLFLMINALTGSPLLPNVAYATDANGDVPIALDGFIWAAVTGFFHYYFIYYLLRDERDVKLESPEHEAVWRFFYRRSGMRRLEFLEVVRHAEFLDFQAGESIVDSAHSVQYFHLVIEGLVHLETVYNDVPSPDVKLHSGDFFDLEVGNVFGVRLGFESDAFEARAETKCRIMRWSFEEMNRMASHCAPAVASFWRNMLLYTMANELNRIHPGISKLGSLDSCGEPEDEALSQGGMSRDFTAGLDDEEKGEQPSVMSWVLKSIRPFPIPGLRHNALPTSGVTARNRVNALRKAIHEAGPGYHPSASSDRGLRRSSLGLSILRHTKEMQNGERRNGPNRRAPGSPSTLHQRVQRRLASVKSGSERRPPPAAVVEMPQDTASSHSHTSLTAETAASSDGRAHVIRV